MKNVWVKNCEQLFDNRITENKPSEAASWSFDSIFDTDNKDFDQRLAMVIGQGEGGFEKGFWEHHDSLNRWTLKFNEKARSLL
ncbi:hypothetical protein ANCCEY_09397 [Ancylostoma ceylanicum]|uniref:Uncharacterized protein n=1 Tax=Ancylostoma ceylanicum TaxID=53326 RepID=A0A0D6LK09_9BILA|nr:hypothetical protein ANCCEY_09397 [Ancylostoma ceylanicum]